MIIGVTGHRPEKITGYDPNHPLIGKLKNRFREILINHQATSAISGFAIGCDIWFAEVVLDLKLPLIAAIPFNGQEARWPVESQKRYHELLSRASKKEIVAPGGYASWKLQARNEWIVDHCDHLIAVYDGRDSGGTYKCLISATKIGRPITRINPTDL